jgi:hypothetical protein
MFKRFNPPLVSGDEGWVDPGMESNCTRELEESDDWHCTLDEDHDGPCVAHGYGERAGSYVIFAKWSRLTVANE